MTRPVFRVADDGLSRQRWDFDARNTLDYIDLRLVRYSIERRKTTRSRFAGADAVDRWDSFDTRSYNSRLPQPVDIPDDVLREAVSIQSVDVFIGWYNIESKIGSFEP